MYKLQGEFGNDIYSGTKHNCELIKTAMVNYGILERKLHIVEPEGNELVIPEEIKYRLVDEYICSRVENFDKWDHVEYEVDSMSDLEFFKEYECYCFDDEREPDTNVKIVRDIIAGNALMKVIEEA